MQVLSRLSRFIPVAAMLLASLAHAEKLADKAVIYLHTDDASSPPYGMEGATEVTWTHGVDGLISHSPRYGDQRYAINIGYQGGYNWTFNFAAPMYNKATNTYGAQPLAIGLYENAATSSSRSPTRPGLEVSGSGYWGYESSGWFNVLDVAYNAATGDLERFAVDFRQIGSAQYPSSSGLFGSLRFNSDMAITPVPEPHTYAMLLGGLAVVAFRMRRRQRGEPTMS